LRVETAAGVAPLPNARRWAPPDTAATAPVRSVGHTDRGSRRRRPTPSSAATRAACDARQGMSGQARGFAFNNPWGNSSPRGSRRRMAHLARARSARRQAAIARPARLGSAGVLRLARATKAATPLAPPQTNVATQLPTRAKGAGRFETLGLANCSIHHSIQLSSHQAAVLLIAPHVLCKLGVRPPILTSWGQRRLVPGG